MALDLGQQLESIVVVVTDESVEAATRLRGVDLGARQIGIVGLDTGLGLLVSFESRSPVNLAL